MFWGKKKPEQPFTTTESIEDYYHLIGQTFELADGELLTVGTIFWEYNRNERTKHVVLGPGNGYFSGYSAKHFLQYAKPYKK